MNRLLVRPIRATLREHLVRFALVAAFLAAGAIGWHIVRPWVLTAAARSSIGCEPRSQLIAHVLGSLHPEYFQTPGYYLWSTCGKRARVVVLYASRGSENHCFFADDSLSAIGVLRSVYLSDHPDDMDADGRIEVIAQSGVYSTGPLRSAVVRLGPSSNELLGVATHLRQRPPGLWAAWRDEDGDGSVEFVLLSPPAPGAVTSTQPWHVEAAAVFEWTAPGGVLRPRYMPADGSVIFWAPPGGRPVPFASDESLGSVMDRVLAEPASPSSAPSSSAP
jgi:hypothetical protein